MLLFSFIRYTQPAWQFNLLPNVQHAVASSCIDIALYPQLVLDEQYQTQSARLADAGYTLVNQGHLLTASTAQVQALTKLPAPSLHDEYVFVRKYWGTFWAWYALFIRLFTFHNPFKEIVAFLSTAKVKKVNLFNTFELHAGYKDFHSPLLLQQPLVAVIIPTLNRYTYLKDVLHDLEKQAYTNFEVIVVDQSDHIDTSFYQQFQLKLTLITQKEKLLWTARNNAVRATAADYLLFFDDDSRVNANWIEEHLKCIDYFNCSISAGVSLAAVGQKIPQSYSYFRWATQFDSGNAMIKRSVMQQIGMFDETFNGQRMGDGEFGYRAYMAGISSISNPNAARVHLKVSTGGLREMGSWDAFRSIKWFAPKPLPSVVYLFKKYFPPALYRNVFFIGIMLSNVPYRYKGRSGMLALSVVLTIIKSPVLLVQYYRAVKMAGNMQQSAVAPTILE